MPGPTNGTRMYLGNLPPDVSEKNIRERLKTYGRAADVDIKHRKDHEGRVTATFAHCTLNIDQATIQQCLADINQQKWNGYTTKAEVAKESYLQRMQAKRTTQNQDYTSSYSQNNFQPYQENVTNSQSPEKLRQNWEENSKKCDILKKKKSPDTSKNDKKAKKREYKEDSSDSEIEIFWQKNFQSEVAVEMDAEEPNTDQVKARPGSLLSKLESFSSVWGDSAPVQDSTPFRITDTSPRKNKKFEQANSFDTHRKTEREREITESKVRVDKREKNGTKSKKSAEVEGKNGMKLEPAKREKAKKVLIGEDEKTKKNDDVRWDLSKTIKNAKIGGNASDKNVIKFEPAVKEKKPDKEKDKKVPNGVAKWDPSKSKKQQVSEQQRLKSLSERVDQRDQQQALVRQALAGQPANKKIKFDDSVEATSTTLPKKHYNMAETPGRLFEDSDESDSEHDFAIRKQFEGKKGEKLLELQSRFATDSRFRLDSRFAESEEEEGEEQVEEQLDEEEEEQKKQLSILDSILGPNSRVTVKPAKKRDNRLTPIVRFDPSKPEHAQKYKVLAEAKPTKKSKKLREEEEEQESKNNETAMPEVSSERFYEVSSGLQQTLQPKSDFSLRALFGDNVHEQEEQESGSEEQSVEATSQPLVKQREATPRPAASVKIAATWSESFFFKPQDHRLQEGADYFANRNEESKPEFEQRRRELWTAVKSKLRNVTKKKVTFERKLGGKSTKHRRFKPKRTANPRRK